MSKPMFEPGKFLPIAFRTKTKKGKEVFRIQLNIDEILARVDEGKMMMAIDIPTKNGLPKLVNGTNSKGGWTGLNYYAWAVEKKEEQNEVKTVQASTV